MEESKVKSGKSKMTVIIIVIFMIVASIILAPIAFTILMFILMMAAFACDSPKSTAPWCPTSMLPIENSMSVTLHKETLFVISNESTKNG